MSEEKEPLSHVVKDIPRQSGVPVGEVAGSMTPLVESGSAPDASRPAPAPPEGEPLERREPVEKRESVERRESVEKRERFDHRAVREALAAGSSGVQACIVAANMFRGEIALVIEINESGRVVRVEPAPGGRVIEPEALTCIRRHLTVLRLSSGAGELVFTFSI